MGDLTDGLQEALVLECGCFVVPLLAVILILGVLLGKYVLCEC